MIRRFNDYEQTKPYGDYEPLPRGGYVLKILNAERCENRNKDGYYIKVSCDIAEGEYQGHFMNLYLSNNKEDKKWPCNHLVNEPKDDGSEKDKSTKRWFRTFTDALEESNPGYHFDWDERKFKGKLIGGLFNEREYETNDGKVRRTTNLARLCTVEQIRSGNYRIPDDKLLSGPVPPQAPADTGWMNIPDGIDSELPFN